MWRFILFFVFFTACGERVDVSEITLHSEVSFPIAKDTFNFLNLFEDLKHSDEENLSFVYDIGSVSIRAEKITISKSLDMEFSLVDTIFNRYSIPLDLSFLTKSEILQNGWLFDSARLVISYSNSLTSSIYSEHKLLDSVFYESLIYPKSRGEKVPGEISLDVLDIVQNNKDTLELEGIFKIFNTDNGRVLFEHYDSLNVDYRLELPYSFSFDYINNKVYDIKWLHPPSLDSAVLFLEMEEHPFLEFLEVDIRLLSSETEELGYIAQSLKLLPLVEVPLSSEILDMAQDAKFFSISLKMNGQYRISSDTQIPYRVGMKVFKRIAN